MTDDAANKMAKYMSRPSAEQVAAQTQKAQEGGRGNGKVKPKVIVSKNKGLRCPHCHVINVTEVYRTIPDEGLIRRQRICRNCKKRFDSYETA